MAEIPESDTKEPETPANESEIISEIGEPVAEFDPTTMRKTKPGLKRLFLTLTVLFSFFLGLPFFLKSIEIYRSSLPFRAIDSLSNQIESNPLVFPCRFQVVFLGFDRKSFGESPADKLGFLIIEQMRKLTGNDPICGGCGKNYTVSVTIESGTDCIRNQNAGTDCLWRCGAMDISGFGGNLKDDEAVDEVLDSILEGNGDCSDSGGKIYSVVVMNRDEESRVVIGKHRHAWILGRDWEMDAAVPRIADIFVKFFMNGGREEGLVHGELMPVGADGRVILSFSLLNADPHDWIYDWDFRTIDENLLAPVIEALAPVANISVESQVLYHTPKSSSLSYWDEELDCYIFSTKDLPFFVNSNEWHLDTSIAASGRSKILQVVVYIPSANECPLRLQLPNGEISITNGFISPMWGGVIIWNPPSCLKDSESRHPARHTISSLDLQMVFEVFMGQLRQLFGLNSSNLHVAELGISNLLASERGFTEWELDVLSRHHTCFNLLSCVTTLGSLSRLVQSLPRMIIMDEIGKQVKFSLEDAKLAQSNASLGTYDGSAVSSRQARALAEDAFFHPSIMSVSYYSFEHCFAIYTPFFLPVLLHVLLAAFKEWRRYKRERTKYLAWKVKANVAS